MKSLHWIGNSLKKLKEFPEEARKEVGFALYLAQMGDKAINAVPLVGFGSAKVLEILIDESGNSFRAVYTVKFEEAVYTLHAFQKKSKRGIETSKADICLIRSRLKMAEAHYKEHYMGVGRKDQANGTDSGYRRRSD